MTLCPRHKVPANRYSRIVHADGSFEPPQFFCALCDAPTAAAATAETAAPVATLFDAWASINGVISPDRSRFDWLRENMPKATSLDDLARMIRDEGYADRYPLLPQFLSEEA